MNKVYIFFVLIIFLGCKKPVENPVPTTTLNDRKAAVTNYSNIVYATYQDSYTKALALKSASELFIANPSEVTFTAVKNSWLESRVPYEQSEAFRFYNGPIDDKFKNPEALLNSWPMDEAFIDYVQGNMSAGIINNPKEYPVINAAVLDSLNGLGGETEISTGYHAVEFLLWGQDFNASGPGNRPFTDYVIGGTNSNQFRRRQYLTAAIDHIIKNLQYITSEWEEGKPNYRATFVSNPDSSLNKILSGMGKFAKGELAQQRMSVALQTHEQEEEHSCFSDNTTNDIILGQLSIENIYKGKYISTNGTIIEGMGIDDLLKKVNSNLNDATIIKIDAASKLTKAIPQSFDQAILFGNPGELKVLEAINAIKAEADQFVEVASALNLSVLL